MSAGLVKKLLPCVDIEEDKKQPVQANGHTPKPEPALERTPTIMIRFSQVLKQQKMQQHTAIGAVLLRAKLQVLESDVRQNRLVGVSQLMELTVDERDIGGSGASSPQEWWERHRGPQCSLPYALSVSLISYDARQMPLDTQISLLGFETEFERRMGERVPRDSSMRDHILIGKHEMPLGDKPRTLLTRPLVCTEPLTKLSFASVEAVGFNSAYFWKEQARRVPESKRARIARLFFRGPPTELNDATMQHGSDSGSRVAYFTVPLAYRYTSLIQRVHVYLTLQQLRRESVYEIDVDSIDPAVYELPSTSQHYIFEQSSLNAAVRYIDERLVDVHPTFDPKRLKVMLEPLTFDSWTDAWLARENVARTLDNNAHIEQRRRVYLPGERQNLTCEAVFRVYFAVFRQSVLDPAPRAAADAETESETDVPSSQTDVSLPSYVGVPRTSPRTDVAPVESGGSNDYGSWRDFLPPGALDNIPTLVPVPKAVSPGPASPSSQTAKTENPLRANSNSHTTKSDDDDDDDGGEDDEVVFAPRPKLTTDTPCDSGSLTIPDPIGSPLRPTRAPPVPPELGNQTTRLDEIMDVESIQGSLE